MHTRIRRPLTIFIAGIALSGLAIQPVTAAPGQVGRSGAMIETAENTPNATPCQRVLITPKPGQMVYKYKMQSSRLVMSGWLTSSVCGTGLIMTHNGVDYYEVPGGRWVKKSQVTVK